MKQFDNSNTLIDTVDKLPNNITLNIAILMTCVTKDDGKVYPQLFLNYAWYDK